MGYGAYGRAHGLDAVLARNPAVSFIVPPCKGALDRTDVALIVPPMLIAWRQLREQIVAFDKAIRALVKSKSDSPCAITRLNQIIEQPHGLHLRAFWRSEGC
jgi:hypothetical protein